MSASLEEANQLFKAGERDLVSFQLLKNTGQAPNETLGFLAQQACEKFIKATMVLNSITVARTHDLEYLFELAQNQGLIVPIPVDRLRQLNPYAVAFRYESSGQEWLSETEAANMIETLYRWAQSSINKST